jgi:NAD(P)H-dependent flavin oxidoreductase YrpB (nitropropane dioxygenase family)
MVREGLAMKRGHDLRWRQVFMAANAPVLYKTALLDGRADIGIMATGQVVGLIDDLPSCKELIDRIMRQAGDVLDRLSG